MEAIEGVKKGYIIDDEFVENENGNFYEIDSPEALEALLERYTNKGK